MIIYIDINHDTKSEEYRSFEALINKIGLKSWRSNTWTRFTKSGENSNIDTIIYSMHLYKIINVEYLAHDSVLSDHRGIIVKIKNKNGFKVDYE